MTQTRPTRARPTLLLALLAALLFAACTSDDTADADQPAEPTAATSTPASDQPYAGFETRPIRALDPKLVEDLLAGRGAGYALAAELNHYPGPTHVLKMAEELALTPEQNAAVQRIFDAMQVEAQALGQQLVDLEADLNQQFSDRTITKPLLQQLTADIALVDGQLRAVHLAAHLDLVALLSQDQIDKYDELRGYGGDPAGAMDHSQHSTE